MKKTLIFILAAVLFTGIIAGDKFYTIPVKMVNNSNREIQVTLVNVDEPQAIMYRFNLEAGGKKFDGKTEVTYTIVPARYIVTAVGRTKTYNVDLQTYEYGDWYKCWAALDQAAATLFNERAVRVWNLSSGSRKIIFGQNSCREAHPQIEAHWQKLARESFRYPSFSAEYKRY